MSSHLLLFLLLAWLSVRRIHSQQCLSLSRSQTCPSFSPFYVSIGDPNFVARPWLANVSNIDSFDAGLRLYANSSSFWHDILGCPLDPNLHIYARYSESVVCAQLIFDVRTSLPCNFEHNILPRQLCLLSCLQSLESVKAIIKGTSFCPSALSELGSISEFCMNNEALSGTAPDCVNASTNEPTGCGFQGDQQALCLTCQDNNSISCCRGLSCPTITAMTNIGPIVGGVVGGVVFLLLAAGAAMYWWWYRRRQQGIKYKEQPTEDEHTETWSLPNATHTDSNPQDSSSDVPPATTTTIPPTHQGFYRAIYSNTPQSNDEIPLMVNDILVTYHFFDDGWAVGDNITTGERGFFPIPCIVPLHPEQIDRLLLEADLTPLDESSRRVAEDDAMDEALQPLALTDIQQLCRSLSTRANYRPRWPDDSGREHLQLPGSLPQRSVSMHAPTTPSRYKASTNA